MPTWQRKLAALAEVLAVLVIGNVLARLISNVIGFAGSKQQLNETIAEGIQPDFLQMAWLTAGDLLIKYGILCGLAFLIGWWHRKRPIKAYGLSCGGFSIGYLILTGVVLFAAAGFLPQLLLFLNKFISLGPGPSHWEALSGEQTWEFWIFMAVSSFALVPIVEEFFTRGYMQTRLTEDFGPGAAIFITAFIFAFAHAQYFRLSVMSLGMLISIILMSLFAGYVFYRTKSLVPVIVAHALGNIPYEGWVEKYLIFFLLAIIILSWKPIIRFGKGFFQETSAIDSKGALIGILFLIACSFVIIALYLRPLFLFTGIILGIIALILEFREKRILHS
jgi:membrane protease YdiL (CAAX protease family)